METLVWVVTSSPYASSVREYCGITCALLPLFSVIFFSLPTFPSRSEYCTKPAIQAAHRHPFRYLNALLEQPHARILPAPLDTLIPVVLFALGQTLVATSSWALGFTGRFLGDYFGILIDHRVEGFPFNVLRDPMYVGSTMSFAATALWCVSVVPRIRVGGDTWSGVDFSFPQVRASRWFADHLVRLHCVHDRAQV